MSGAYTPQQFRGLWAEFDDPSWAPWGSVEDAIFGTPPEDLAMVQQVTGRERLPSQQVDEFYGIVGRGGGKSRFAARLCVYFACGRQYKRVPGERIFVAIFAPDRKQAAVTFRYVLGLLRAVPALEQLVEREQRDAIELNNGVTIEVITASLAAPRGRAYALAIVEEAAFLPQGDSANPDTELLRALRPALARVPGSLLCVLSSPYAQRGVLWRAWKRHHGNNDNDHILVVQADTRTMNPAFPVGEIERAYQDDPAVAAAEYGAEFRTDIQGFVPQEVVESCTCLGRHELPPMGGEKGYVAFLDLAGGSGQDSATLAIAHGERRGDGQQVAVLDLVREVRPKFSPQAVCADFADVLKRYGVKKARADRYAGDFPIEAMKRHGITLEPAKLTKGAIYKELLPALNSGTVELLDVPRLATQLQGLERRVARGGRDSIDHAPGGHDDLINAAAGALVAAAHGPRRYHTATWGRGAKEEPREKGELRPLRFRQGADGRLIGWT